MRYGKLSRQLASLAGPIFIETLLVMTLGAVDTFMLSRYSDNSVAAVGVVNQLMNLVFLLFEVISLGTSILCSQYIGAGRRDKVVQVVGISLMFNLLSGVILSSCLYLFADDMLLLMGLRPDLMSEGLPYMKIVGGFAFFQAISLSLSASLRSADKAKYPMYVSVVVNILNIIGNYTLIFGKFGMPALGVEGAAISTSVCRFVSVVILFAVLFKKHIPSFPKELFTPFPWVELKNLLKIGIPSAGEHFSYSLSQVVITYFINMISNQALATRSYVVNIVMFTYIFALSIAQGGAILIGHLVGMKKIKAAHAIGKRVMRLGVAMSVSLSLVTAIFGRHILGMLTTDPWIISTGATILWIEILLENGRALNFFGVNSLRSAGDIYFPVLVGIVVMWGVQVVGSYVLGISLGWGLIAMWAVFALDENIRGFIFLRRWNSFKWVGKSFVGSK
ncbi:MAG: MATE family efflux transporter [Bacteroidales bacterium]|nr:MATE family efflux transporter [Bacteroidales bacterium]